MAAPAGKQRQFPGLFATPDEQEVFGNLHLKGRKTVLHLQPKRELSQFAQPAVINGQLGDLRKVSCLECIVGATGSGHRGDAGRYHYADVFPHFVTVGERHLAPDKPHVKAIHFSTQDIPLIFYDFDAFGHVLGSKSVIESIVKESRHNRDIAFGDAPEIFYFSGKYEIIAAETPIGRFRVSHFPKFSVGSSNGKFIENSMMASLEYAQPVDFDTCIERLMSIHRFLSLVAGRKQSVDSITLELLDDLTGTHSRLELHWMFAPKAPSSEDDKPSPGDIPVNAVHRPEEFRTVLSNWLDRESKWRDARVRYVGCMGKSNSYGIDRLVAAANMFDILPSDAGPVASNLSPELAKAQKECREIFKRLTPGFERDSMLGALGRMNKSSLTKKVLHRVAIVNKALAERFPDLELVASTAVKVRNFFVHGSSDGLNYKRLESSMPFLTDALEFIFATSDLIDAGWDAVAWGNSHYGFGHS